MHALDRSRGGNDSSIGCPATTAALWSSAPCWLSRRDEKLSEHGRTHGRTSTIRVPFSVQSSCPSVVRLNSCDTLLALLGARRNELSYVTDNSSRASVALSQAKPRRPVPARVRSRIVKRGREKERNGEKVRWKTAAAEASVGHTGGGDGWEIDRMRAPIVQDVRAN